MKLKSIVQTKNYSLNINKKFFEDKLKSEKISTVKRMYYFCYNTYLSILKTCERIDKTTDKNELRRLQKKLTHFENRLQSFWGFDPNEDFHIYWALPHSCSCTYKKRYDCRTIRNISPFCKIHS